MFKLDYMLAFQWTSTLLTRELSNIYGISRGRVFVANSRVQWTQKLPLTCILFWGVLCRVIEKQYVRGENYHIRVLTSHPSNIKTLREYPKDIELVYLRSFEMIRQQTLEGVKFENVGWMRPRLIYNSSLSPSSQWWLPKLLGERGLVPASIRQAMKRWQVS